MLSYFWLQNLWKHSTQYPEQDTTKQFAKGKWWRRFQNCRVVESTTKLKSIHWENPFDSNKSGKHSDSFELNEPSPILFILFIVYIVWYYVSGTQHQANNVDKINSVELNLICTQSNLLLLYLHADPYTLFRLVCFFKYLFSNDFSVLFFLLPMGHSTTRPAAAISKENRYYEIHDQNNNIWMKAGRNG